MKIIAYDDNPDFGGHQIMACLGVESLTVEPSNELYFFVHPSNLKLTERLEKIQRCRVVESPCTTRKLQGIRNHIARRGIRQLSKRFSDLDADLLLCIQGNIEQSSQALLAARRIGLDSVSYLALPHSMAVAGARMGTLRDWMNRSLWKQPKRYITISEGMEKLLHAHSADRSIKVVHNGLPAPPPVERTKHECFTLGMAGRIEFTQKRQDAVVKAFCNHPDLFSDCRLLIIGDGPDRAALQQMIAECPRKTDICLEPWQSDLNPFFSSIDMLAVPSRYEGVPLVMLEALARGIPVIGSDRDGMRDLLPAEWTFETGNDTALAETCRRVREQGQTDITALQQKILREFTLEAFSKNFAEAVTGRL